MLGSGWYNQNSVNVGPKSLIVLLSVDTSDGQRTYFPSALANEAAKTISAGVSASPLVFSSAAGPVVADDIYVGETYDARLLQAGWNQCGFKPANPWAPAVAVTNPLAKGAAFSWHSVQIRVDRTYSPVSVTQPKEGVYVFDFGQNMAGQTQFNVICPNGPQWIYHAYGESLHPDGTVLNQYGNIMNANYTCAGTGEVETYSTMFSYYGFRYVQVTNYPGTPDESAFTAYFTHSDVEQTGSFNTNNALMNSIQHCTRFASLSNLVSFREIMHMY